ncbi:replication protein A 70 kDa DNA-binding subunit E-like [Raphanus sativus]|uniref:Replication protein A 70 kDa DNA-binding subunit E-like n=1 Tax=Raphanus sativus TaxID=3726 RepID=A0A9W3C8Q7_RAPSA|nr:replication protein A 70 kDa DNA-binding subunit E-like [Raphanus sativus]
MLNGEVKGGGGDDVILQVIEIKMLQQAQRNQEQSVERYKVAVSDGIQSQEDMLSAASNVLVKQGSIKIGSILRLTRFNCSPVRNRSFGILMTATLQWKGIPTYIIGIGRGISATVGLAATVVYPLM